MAPAAVPPATMTRLHAALVSAAQSPETRERYAALGIDPVVSASPAAFTTFVREEFARWEKVVRSTGIKLAAVSACPTGDSSRVVMGLFHFGRRQSRAAAPPGAAKACPSSAKPRSRRQVNTRPAAHERRARRTAAQVGTTARLCRRRAVPSLGTTPRLGQTRGGGDSASRFVPQSVERALRVRVVVC